MVLSIREPSPIATVDATSEIVVPGSGWLVFLAAYGPHDSAPYVRSSNSRDCLSRPPMTPVDRSADALFRRWTTTTRDHPRWPARLAPNDESTSVDPNTPHRRRRPDGVSDNPELQRGQAADVPGAARSQGDTDLQRERPLVVDRVRWSLGRQSRPFVGRHEPEPYRWRQRRVKGLAEASPGLAAILSERKRGSKRSA
jgi:hypothetical protein